ncbi:MAG: ISNCY family transposase [Candidatus Brocadiaceae bacterium]|nr:ISNCY family transposase [Candidatus Brocadiaceae bacterium]MDR4509209.1 ISNCY family transposase [Candidatus Brocadiaceae bacterium]
MRKNYEQQRSIGSIPISEVKIPLKSRDELPPILRALQYIFITPALKEQVFEILKSKVLKGKKKTGRYGMGLWEIFVLSVVRLGLDANYDRLEDFANYHKLIRQIMGVDTPFGEGKSYSYQSIKDNVSLLDEETLGEINEIVVSSGHRLLKKKEGIEVKADTYVLETNVRFPTDLNLLWEAGRKCVDAIEYFRDKGFLRGKGWRKHKFWKRELKNLMRSSSRAAFGGGKNKEATTKRRIEEYLCHAGKLSEKVAASVLELYEEALLREPIDLKYVSPLKSLEYFHKMLDKHVDLVERRLLQGERIPSGEKVHSLFEPHTEWLSKGKANKRVELGHNILVASDQWGFIVYHKVVEKEADVSLALPLADALLGRYGEEGIASISFDKGFYKKENKDLLKLYIPQVVMPKKGKKNREEEAEESSRAFKKLRHRHSAVESDINRLEHHGLDRCPDKGLFAYKRYCALGIVAANLHKLGNVLKDQAIKKQEKLPKAA